jgi:hypothetical protein
MTGIEGTKDNPTKLKTGGAVQVDGMALEFNIPPVTNGKDFCDVTYETLYEIRKMVDKKLEFVFRPIMDFNPDIFEKTPKKYKELGCDPDYDAHNGGLEKTPPAGSGDKPFRTAGGHLHFGWIDLKNSVTFDHLDPRHIYDCNPAVKVCEYATYSFIDHDVYYFPTRSQLYGSRGSYRPKPYGMEWRTPSNIWLNFSRAGIGNMVDGLLQSLQKLFKKGEYNLNYVDLPYGNVLTESANRCTRRYFERHGSTGAPMSDSIISDVNSKVLISNEWTPVKVFSKEDSNTISPNVKRKAA